MRPSYSFLIFLSPFWVAHADVWTPEKAVAHARETAPTVQLAKRKLQEAEAHKVGAGVPFPTNPRVFADYRPLTVEMPGQPTEPRNGYNVGVDGTFEVSGASGLRVEEARRNVETAQKELLHEQTQAAVRAWSSWVHVRLAENQVARLEDNLLLQKQLEFAAQERVNQGVAGEPELLTVQAELASVEGQWVQAQQALLSAQSEFRYWLDMPATEAVTLADSPLSPLQPSEESVLVQRALEKRADLAAVRARLVALDATQSRLLRESLPKMGYNVGVDAAPASPVFAFIGLSVELPVAQRNQGPRAVARAQKETEKVRLESLLRQLYREVAYSRESYEKSRQQASLLAERALPAAKRAQQLIELGWRSGKYDIFRFVAANRDVIRLEQEYLAALRQAWDAYIQLQEASGGLSP